MEVYVPEGIVCQAFPRFRACGGSATAIWHRSQGKVTGSGVFLLMSSCIVFLSLDSFLLRAEPAAMAMDSLLQLLSENAKYTTEQLAQLASLPENEVVEKIKAWEADGTILGYQAVVNTEAAGEQGVAAFIEVKLTPERGGGFDRLAMRIARFDQVSSCYLASGGYDLMVVVEGAGLRDVARFVSEKLSTIEGVLSTATHFRLKTYKANGLIFEVEEPEGRLPVTP